MEDGRENNRFFFEEFEVDSLKRILLKGGEPIALSSKTFDLLVTLVEHPGQILSKQTLLDLVWANQFVEEKNLTVHIATLRKALGEGKNEHRFIATIPGNGYKFVAYIKASSNGNSSTDRVHSDSVAVANGLLEKGRERRGLASRRVVIAAVISVLMIAIVAGGFVWRKRFSTFDHATVPSQNITIRRLTSDGLATVTALSPDGKLFAYSHLEGEDQSLWLGHIDGGDPIQVRPPEPVIYLDLKFSPDTTSIFYTLTDDNRESGAVYKMPVFGGLPQKVKDKPYSIAFSPTGNQFAFVRNDPGGSKPILVISDANGKNEIELAAPPDSMSFVKPAIAWSPDGSIIAIGASRSETNTGYEVLTVDTANGKIAQLTNSEWDRIGTLAWLTDGTGLVVIGQKKESTQPQIWSVSFPNGEVKRLVSDLNLYASSIGLGKDQNTLLSVQTQTQSNIWVAPTGDLSQAKQITYGSIGRRNGWFGIGWTTDGKIIYTATVGENNTIWTMNTNGTDQKQLIPFKGNNLFPSVSADGRVIVFQSNIGGNFAVWRANRDGSGIRKLTDTGIAAQPDISPDGRWIVFVSNQEDAGELKRVTISGEDIVTLAHGASWPQISRDSGLIACGYQVDGNTELAILSIDGGTPIKIFRLAPRANLRNGINWTPDGRSVTYRDWVNGLWRQDLAGGEPERMKGLPNEKLYAYDWSPDGKYLAFARGMETRDVVLISGFKQQ